MEICIWLSRKKKQWPNKKNSYHTLEAHQYHLYIRKQLFFWLFVVGRLYFSFRCVDFEIEHIDEENTQKKCANVCVNRSENTRLDMVEEKICHTRVCVCAYVSHTSPNKAATLDFFLLVWKSLYFHLFFLPSRQKPAIVITIHTFVRRRNE